MCVNQRYITNKYTRKQLYVKCGHCPACLQEKASHRVNRIKNTSTSDNEVLMVTLTYNRYSVPYILRDDAYNLSKNLCGCIPVFRDTFYRKVRLNGNYRIGYKKISSTKSISSLDYIHDVDFSGVKDLRYQPGKIGVCYYPDLQAFMARLRLNLKRHFNYDEPFKAYCCSEYGTRSHRPHFHLLLFVKKGDYETFRIAVCQSWPFSRLQDFDRSVEKAFRASSYVASYVNCGSDFPKFLELYAKPKHSYSKGFGLGNFMFSLSKILELYKRGSFRYNILTNKDGKPFIRSVPIPKYVIHRYFPKFTGYSRIPCDTLVENIRRVILGHEESFNKSVGSSYIVHPSLLSHSLSEKHISLFATESVPLYLDSDSFRRFHVRLKNAYQRFLSDSIGIGDFSKYSVFDYARLHSNIWNLYNSSVLRLHMENEEVKLNEKYDNLDIVYNNHVYYGVPLPVGFSESDFKVTDPNMFSSVVHRTDVFARGYYDNIKHRNVSNVVYSSLNEEF